jgi:hypothetical protein
MKQEKQSAKFVGMMLICTGHISQQCMVWQLAVVVLLTTTAEFVKFN